MAFKQTLFRIARSKVAGYFIGFSFAYLTQLMPVDKLLSTPDVVVFRHPVPWWQTHLLGVPKKRLPSFTALDLTDIDTQNKILGVFAALQQTAVSHHISPFSIVVNGGHYQDVPQIHFHLASGKTNAGDAWGLERWEPPMAETAVSHHHNAIAYAHHQSTDGTHRVIGTETAVAHFTQFDFNARQNRQTMLAMLQLAQQQVAHLNLAAFRLQINAAVDGTEPLSFHLIA